MRRNLGAAALVFNHIVCDDTWRGIVMVLHRLSTIHRGMNTGYDLLSLINDIKQMAIHDDIIYIYMVGNM